MKRRIVITSVLLTAIGLAMTLVIAWGCALGLSPDTARDGRDPAVLNKVRREFYERVGPDPGGADPGTLFVSVAHVRPGVRFLDVAIEDEDLGADSINGPMPFVAVTQAGWPFLAMEACWFRDASRFGPRGPDRFEAAHVIPNRYVSANRLYVPRMIPLRPLWPGFAIGVAFWSMVAGVIWFGPMLVIRLYRWRSSRCLGCGYPIGSSGVCTECGRAIGRRGSPAKL